MSVCKHEVEVGLDDPSQQEENVEDCVHQKMFKRYGSELYGENVCNK